MKLIAWGYDSIVGRLVGHFFNRIVPILCPAGLGTSDKFPLLRLSPDFEACD